MNISKKNGIGYQEPGPQKDQVFKKGGGYYDCFAEGGMGLPISCGTVFD